MGFPMTRKQLGADEPIRSITLEFDLIPSSAKNRTEIRKRGARRWVSKSKAAESSQAAMTLLARRATQHWGAGSLFGRNYVRTEIVVDPTRRRTRVTIHDLGEQPRSGVCWTKFDVHGVVESVMDALQGVVFDDDRQSRGTVVELGDVE